MNIILLGPPGCGKGTQAEHICHTFHLTYVSTGNMIREEITRQTSLGKHLKNIIDRGDLVSDEIVFELIQQKCHNAKRGFLFDGFPRTLKQAKLLDAYLEIDCVIELHVSDEEVIKRISQRFMVEKNHSQYTFQNKLDALKFVRIHGGNLFHRQDDTPEVITKRLAVYHAQTQPLISYYGKQHKIFLINGEKSINQVSEDVEKLLHRRM